MIKAWRAFWDQFLNNEAFFIARVRALVMFFALSGLTFGHDLAESLGWPGVERYVKVLAVVCGGISLLMRAGDKTPENVKELADRITPPEGTPKVGA